MAARYPLDFMKVKLSLKKAGETAVSIVSGVLKQHGVSGLYLGITPKLAKSAAQKFVYFYFYEALLQVRQRLSPVPVSALGNLGLALRVILDWIDERTAAAEGARGTRR